MGWMAGLGQGLQDAAKAVPLYTQLKQQALQNALQQQQEEREATKLRMLQNEAADRDKQQKYENAFKVWQNLPEGTAYNEQMQFPDELKAAVTRMDARLTPTPTPTGLEGFTSPGGTTTESLQRMVVPSETAAARASLARQTASDAAKMERTVTALRNKSELEKIRYGLMTQLEQYRAAGRTSLQDKNIQMRMRELDQRIAEADSRIAAENAKLGIDTANYNLRQWQAQDEAFGGYGGPPPMTTQPIPQTIRGTAAAGTQKPSLKYDSSTNTYYR